MDCDLIKVAETMGPMIFCITRNDGNKTNHQRCIGTSTNEKRSVLKIGNDTYTNPNEIGPKIKDIRFNNTCLGWVNIIDQTNSIQYNTCIANNIGYREMINITDNHRKIYKNDEIPYDAGLKAEILLSKMFAQFMARR